MLTTDIPYTTIYVNGPFSIRYTEINGKPVYLIGDNHDYYCNHTDKLAIDIDEFIENLLKDGFHLIIEALRRDIAPAYPNIQWGYGDNVSMPRVMRRFELWYADPTNNNTPFRNQITPVDNIRYLMSYDEEFNSYEELFEQFVLQNRTNDLEMSLIDYANRYKQFYNPSDFWFLTNTKARQILRDEYESYVVSVQKFVQRFEYVRTPTQQLKKHFNRLQKVLFSMNPNNLHQKMKELSQVFVELHETIVDYSLMYEFVSYFEDPTNTGIVVFAGYEHIESLQKFIDGIFCKNPDTHCVTASNWVFNYESDSESDSESEDAEFHVNSSLMNAYQKSGKKYPCVSTVSHRRLRSP